MVKYRFKVTWLHVVSTCLCHLVPLMTVTMCYSSCSNNQLAGNLYIIIYRWIWPQAWLTWTEGRGSGGRRGHRRRARTDDVRRPSAGDGRGGGTARGLLRAANRSIVACRSNGCKICFKV